MSDLIRRNDAIGLTMERFRGTNMLLGTNDCIQMARFHAEAMGHKNLPATGSYTTEVGARKALRNQGVESLDQLLDKFFERITPAAALPGDLQLVRHSPDIDLGAVVLSVGRKSIGWHQAQDELAVMTVLEYLAAWRL